MPHFFTFILGRKYTEALKWYHFLFSSRYILISKSWSCLEWAICVCARFCALCPRFPVSFLSEVENFAMQLLALGKVYLPLPHQRSTSGITWLALKISSVVKPPRSLYGSCEERDSNLRMLGPEGLSHLAKSKMWCLRSITKHSLLKAIFLKLLGWRDIWAIQVQPQMGCFWISANESLQCSVCPVNRVRASSAAL